MHYCVDIAPTEQNMQTTDKQMSECDYISSKYPYSVEFWTCGIQIQNLIENMDP